MKKYLVLLMAITFFVGCKPQGTTGQIPTTPPSLATAPGIPTAAPSTPPSAGGDTGGILARINGEPVTDAEVTDRVKSGLRRVESQIFDIKNDGLQDLINEKLLAKEAEKRKMSVDQLLKAEVDDKVENPSEQEIDSFYNMAKQRFNNEPLEKVKDQLVGQIKGTKKGSLYNKFIAQLKKDSKVEVLMKRPRIEVSVDDDPSQGKAGSPITLIEFSDFQCPFCKRTRPTISKIMETYKDKVHYVFRDFPLSFHKNAGKAAEAANCAGDQGKYWEYNTHLWENQGSLEMDKLKEYAKTLSLNEKKFSECLDSGKFADEISKDEKEGGMAGVTGTPAYFVNGIFISGAQPFENFQEIIDQELQSQ